MMIYWTDDQRDYLIRTAAALTPAQQAEALGLPIKAVHGQRYWLRRQGRIADGAFLNWTAEEVARARVMLNDGKSPRQVGRALGRSANAVLAKMTALGLDVRREIARSDGMDVRETAAALGVGRDTVIDWIRRGLLQARRRRVLRQTVYSISYTAVLAFISTHGGYTKTQPAPRFAGPVSDARAAFAQRYISRADLSSALCISENTLGHWPKRFAFPAPLLFGIRSYYERAAVDAFLAAHPALAPTSWWRRGES